MLSMADKNEANESGLSGGEEGVWGWLCVDPAELGLGAENWTMMQKAVLTRSSVGILSYC